MYDSMDLNDYFWEEPMEILKLSDSRLKYIDTRQKGFYDKVLNYVTEDPLIKQFQKIVRIVKKIDLPPFYMPSLQPSIMISVRYSSQDRSKSDKAYERNKTDIIDSKVVFLKNVRICNYTYEAWQKVVNEMPNVEGEKWNIGNEYQYCAFIVYLINSIARVYPSKCIEMVLINTDKLRGQPAVIVNNSPGLGGFYDLMSVRKLIRCTNSRPNDFFVDSFNGRRLFSLIKIDNIDGKEAESESKGSKGATGGAFLVLQ